MKLSKQDRNKIAALSVHQLARFESESGDRLHPTAIRAEITRRVKKAKQVHPAIVAHKQQRASRTLR
jgi:hypothetical protein